MKRQQHHFPSPRRERLTRTYLPDGRLLVTHFLEIDESSFSAPVFYRRSLPKKITLGERNKEKESLVVGRVPEPPEEKSVITQEVREEREETEEQKPITRLVVKKRNVNVNNMVSLLQPAEVREEPSEVLTSYNRVSVVMAFRESGEGRLEGLRKCIQCFREQVIGCYIIVVEQDKTPVHQTELESLVDCYLFTYSNTLFNKSWAFNCGVMTAPDDLILLHDCDILVPRNYVEKSVEILGTRDMVVPWAKIFYLTEESSKQYPGGNRKIRMMLSNNQAPGGSLLVRKGFYLKIGGMDERFEGWGYEDNAFYAKASKLGRIARTNIASGVSVFHHHHKLASQQHSHTNININVMKEYYSRSGMDIMLRVPDLGPIGDPLKYVSQETGKPQLNNRSTRGSALDKVTFLGVATKKERGFHQYIVSCRQNGIDPVILGMGQQWRGFHFKIGLVREYLDHLGGEDFVVVSDCYDAVFQKKSEEFVEAFLRYNKPVVFSAELGIGSPYRTAEVNLPQTPNPLYRSLCAGFWMARVDAAKQMIDEMWRGDFSDRSINDQGFFQKWLAVHPDKGVVDYMNVLVSTAWYNCGKTLECKNGKVYSNDTYTIPCAVHIAGPWDWRPIYNTLKISRMSEQPRKGVKR